MFRKTLSRKSLLITLPLAAFALAGCNNSSDTSKTDSTKTETKAEGTKPEGTASGGSFKVGLVTSGPVSDNGWNAGAYKSLQSIKTELGAEVQNVEAPNAGQREESLRAYASKKFNVVIGHGAEFEELALKIEKEFPNTQFLISSGGKAGTNTTPIIYKLEDGAYLLGMLAAGVSKTGKLGAVGAMKIPPLERIFKAFELGAKAVNPNITLLPAVYTGSWDDPVKAGQQTKAVLDQGADVILQDVDAAAVGVFNAVKERNTAAKPIYALGTNSDQNAVAPEVVLASAPIFYDKTMVNLAKKVKDGNYKPSDTPIGMKDGAIGFVLNPQLAAKVPADLKAKVDTATKDITDGKLDVLKGK